MAQFINTTYCTNCNKQASMFKLLTPEEMTYLNEHRHEVRFNPGETIFKEGGALTHIGCITSGLVKVYTEGINKRNLIYYILKSTSLIGGPGFMVDNRLHYSASALTNVTACFIEVDAFVKVISSNHQFTTEMFKMINRKSSIYMDKLVSLTQKQMPGRIADTLLYLSEEIYNATEFTVDISRQDIADLSAMSKESAIRIIKEFKDANYISCESNDIVIKDIEALKKVSLTG